MSLPANNNTASYFQVDLIITKYVLHHFVHVLACSPSEFLFQTEAIAALRLVEPGGLEDGPVLSASRGPLPLLAGPGQQHLCEAHVHGAERAFRQAIQEEGAAPCF